MRLMPVSNAPRWLKRDPVSGFYYVVKFREGLPRLCHSTKERESKLRAIHTGEMMIARWLEREDPINRTFEECAKDLVREMERRLAAKELRFRTVDNARLFILRQLVPQFGNYRVRDLEDGLKWLDFVVSKRKTHPDKTLYNQYKHMSLVMNYAHRHGLLDKPWKVRNPDPQRFSARIVTDEEAARLVAEAPPMLRLQLLMALTMGMRKGEILGMTWDRIDLERKILHLRAEDTKTKKPRSIKLSPQVLNELEGLSVAVPAEDRRGQCLYLFSHKNGIRVKSNKKAWASTKKRAGIVGRLKFHSLRATFLTKCAIQAREGKVSVPLICAYCGLSIVVFQRHYLSLTADDTECISAAVAVKMGEASSSKNAA